MKIFFALIILTLAFSGYSSASHAMGNQDCSSKSSKQMEECQHADGFVDNDHVSKHEKKDAAKCMDCNHCCASSVVILHEKVQSFSMNDAVFRPDTRQNHPQERQFSLLRPPRTIA